MKNFLKPNLLPAATLIAGGVGLLLRVWLFLGGTDERGLLVTSHPANALVYILTALFLALLFLCVRPLDAAERYQQLFPNPRFSALGCVAAAIGILWVNTQDMLARKDTITTVCLVLGILAALCLLMLAWCRWKQRRPVCYFHVVVTLYLMLHAVSQYRLWSAEPQLQLYFFSLLGSVFLMLTGYHSAVMDARKVNRRWFVFCNQAALFCCFLSLWSESGMFYLAMGLWTLTGLCDLQPQKPEESPQEEA